jgi:uncharacterized protein
MPVLDLPDLNVWLSLVDPLHQHHNRAKVYWHSESAPELAFCRITELGLLRLLTNNKVMRGAPLTAQQAWSAYRNFQQLPEVIFLGETGAEESQFISWTDSPAFTPHRWTDAWLAAIALRQGARLVSFDSDFRHFAGLDFLHLIP